MVDLVPPPPVEPQTAPVPTAAAFFVGVDAGAGEPFGGGHRRRIGEPQVVRREAEFRGEQGRSREPLRQRHGAQPLAGPQADAIDGGPLGGSPEVPRCAVFGGSHLLPASEQRALGRRRSAAGIVRGRYVAHRPGRRHQACGHLHLRLPAAGVVLAVGRPVRGRHRPRQVANLLRVGPAGRKVRRADEPCEPIVVECVQRRDRAPEIERAVDLRLPEPGPVLGERCERRVEPASHRVGQASPSRPRRVDAGIAQGRGRGAVPAPRRDRDEAVGQRRRHARARRRTRHPLSESRLPPQPEVRQRRGAQRRIHERRRSQPIEDRLHRLERQPRQQRAARPEIAHAARRLDERLYRSECERKAGRPAGRSGGVQAGGDVDMLEQRVVRNARIGGKPCGILAELGCDSVRQKSPDRQEPLARARQSIDDFLQQLNRPVRVHAARLQLDAGAVHRVRKPQTVRHADGAFAGRPGRGRRQTLDDGCRSVGVRGEPVKALSRDVTSQRGRGVPCGPGFVTLDAERLVERIVQPRQQQIFPVGLRERRAGIPRHSAQFSTASQGRTAWSLSQNASIASWSLLALRERSAPSRNST